MSLKIKTFDLTLLVIPLLFLVLSVSVIYSLVFSTEETGLALRQGVFAIIGMVVFLVASFTDYRFYRGTNWIFYWIVILLLIIVDYFGHEAGGAMRWIDLGFFQLQPSELAKIFMIITLSSFFSQKIGKIKWKDIAFSLLILCPPLFLILKEPDLGTALVISFIYISILLLSKPNKIQKIVILSFILVFSSLLIFSAYKIKPFDKLLHDYQRNRILTFMNPDLDPYGTGYNVRQAQITVGSGGIFGKGLGRGTQSQLQFLPKPHTDFIFSGIAESFGFFGTVVFLGLFAYLIIKIINIASLAQDNFGMLLSLGAAAMFVFQTFINVGMNLGIAPVTGIPLPFLSYGGSALVSYLFLLGVIQSVFIRHKKIAF